MSQFRVPIVTVDSITAIEGADQIEIANILGYQTIIQKGSFRVGNKAFYLPESSILPENVINSLGLQGKLAGGSKNRVRAIKLRGCLSQGILLPIEGEFIPPSLHKDDYSEFLGVTKYEPWIPESFDGKGIYIGTEHTLNYDIEDLKRYPHVFGEITEVVVTEKIHGTNIQIGILKNFTHEKFFGRDKNIYVASKGLAAKGIVFGTDTNNVYTRTLLSMIDKLEKISSDAKVDKTVLVGEVFGRGVQDLHYSEESTSVRFFDVFCGRYLSVFLKTNFFLDYGLRKVPILYEGKFNVKTIENIVNQDTVVGRGLHMMEGVVITAVDCSQRHPRIGRPILKFVGEKYLMRKDGTEYQ